MLHSRQSALTVIVIIILCLLLSCILFSGTSLLTTPPEVIVNKENNVDPLAGLHPPLARLHPPNRVVLVTGAAGFIGYHVSLALREEWKATVVGVDSFNEYYDIQLKQDRANELIKAGVRIYRGDVCDDTLLYFLFERFNFTNVVHLGAQAGVRHSLDDPVNYINNNIKCYLNLLGVLRDGYKNVSHVYASSSTVYGHYSPTPFTPSQTSHVISNIYAATKVSNEHFAEAFCLQHGLKIVGLRFFTVYGPWGRPDMAVYKFTKNMVSDRPVVLYSSSQPVGRDFTFITDAVNGILQALDYVPTQCGEVYNIGLGKTVALIHLVKFLEDALNMTAKVDYRSLPASDLSLTLADISESQRVLGYEPHVGLEQGIKEFVKWFHSYHSLRKKGEEAQRNRVLESMLEDGGKEIDKVKEKEMNKINSEYQKRMEGLRNKYKQFAERMKETLPMDTRKKNFIYFPGVDSPGSTIIKAHGYRDNEELLKTRCRLTEQCIAFTSKGEFKNHLRPQREWIQTSASEGLYVADIDLCRADLDGCGLHEDCMFTGPSSHNCTCHKGFTKLGSGCIEKYIEGGVSETERNLRLSDYFDGLNWDSVLEKKQFVFFQGLDSPGGDYKVVVGGAGDVQKLKRICQDTHHCLGFNTNGILKYSISPSQKWTHWTRDEAGGSYVLDVDYCSLDLEKCPLHSACFRFSPGNYSCKCEEPWIMSARYVCEHREEGNVNPITKGRGGASHDIIHVIVSCDLDHLPGIPHLLHSILNHMEDTSEIIHFHIVLAGVTDTDFHQYLRCYPPLPSHVTLEVVQLDPKLLHGIVHVYTTSEEVGNLGSLANFGRFFFHELFPHLERSLYLDADTLVIGDIGELWRELWNSEQLLVAAPRNSPTYGNFFSSKVKELFLKRYGVLFGDDDLTFNAGVYGVNFNLWRTKEIHKEVLYWLGQQAREYLWRFGTQPIMLLVGYNQWGQINPLWNVNGLGWNEGISSDIIAAAKLLHWNGKRKPWFDDGLYKVTWSLHGPPICNGHGTCCKTNTRADYRCQCQQNYTGKQCQDINKMLQDQTKDT